MMKYKVVDNKNGIHYIEANDDEHALEIMKTRYINFIFSVLSSDSITIYRPNGYLLAYINSATGDQTVKTMSDWGVK